MGIYLSGRALTYHAQGHGFSPQYQTTVTAKHATLHLKEEDKKLALTLHILIHTHKHITCISLRFHTNI